MKEVGSQGRKVAFINSVVIKITSCTNKLINLILILFYSTEGQQRVRGSAPSTVS